MSLVFGADADELDRLAARMQQTSTGLGLLGRTIGVALNAAPWFGSVADVFRRRWGSQHARSLVEASAFLKQNAEVLRRNAQEQRDASAAAGGASVAPAGDRPPGAQAALDRLTAARSPEDVAAVWDSLSAEQRAWLIANHPDAVGNLDGVPPADRVAANRIRIERDLAELEASGDTSSERYKMLKRLSNHEGGKNPVTGEPYGLPQVYLYDPSGSGRVAVIEGDLSKASNVAVYVPGTGASLDNAAGDLGRGRNLYLAAGAGTAVVTWIGYGAPGSVYPGQNGQELSRYLGDNAMLEKHADQGARQLARSLAGLGVPEEANLTVIGHSYGSLVAVQGARLHGGVDNLLVIGSPGVGLEHASDANVSGGFYAMNATGDPVGRMPIFGENPTDPSFGAFRLSTDATGDYRGVSGHSDYFMQDSVSVRNMAYVVEGDPGSAIHHETGVPEYVGDAVVDYFEAPHRLVDSAQDVIDLPQPIDDMIDVGQGIGRGVSGAVEWGAEAVTGGVMKLFGR